MYITPTLLRSEIDGKEYPNFTDLRSWVPPLDDTIVITAWTIFLTIARVYFQQYFVKVAEDLKVGEHETKKAKIDDLRRKFSEAGWKTLFYAISFTLGMIIVWRLNIFPETINCWVGWPNVPLEPYVRHYYLFQLGFYCHSLYAHFAYEVKRKDWWPLFFHHVVTVGLIFCSYVIGFHRIGLLVLICHDVNDVIFEFGKTFVYRKKEPHTTILFLMVLVSWVISRLFIFPYYVIWSSWYETRTVAPEDVFPFHHSFNFALMFLLCLHVYWFTLMVQIAMRFASGSTQNIEDTREDVDEKTTTKTNVRTTKKKI